MPKTAPNSAQAIDRLNALCAPTRRYLDPDDLRLRQVAKLGQDLLKSDAASGWIVLSGVAALSGDLDLAVEHADKAIRLSNSELAVHAKSSALANFGHFVEAGRLYRETLSVQILPTRSIGEKALSSGTILALDEVLKKADKMPTAVPPSLRESIALAATILRRNKITDENVGSWMEVAGSILRENRLFFFQAPELFATIEEDFEQVNLSLEIDVDSAHVADFNQALIERYFDKGIDVPECFSVSFRSIPEADERLAA